MINHWISPDIAQRLAGSLLHFLWEGAVVAMAAAVTLRLMARQRAEWRYAVSVTALLLMFVSPLVTFVFYAQTGAIARRLLQLIGQDLVASMHSAGQVAANAAWTQWIVALWIIGVGFCSARLAAGWTVSRRFMRLSSETIPRAVTELVDQIKERCGIQKSIRVVISRYIDTPSAMGWLRPAILLPVTAVTGLDEAQLRAVLAHEIAHIRRHDFIINALQRCVESVLFYHPAVWWLSGKIRSEREHCCDDLAIQVCGSRLLYAQALIELERVRSVEPVFAVAATGSSLAMRIRRILGRDVSTPDWQSAAAALSVAIVCILGGVWQSTSIGRHRLYSGGRLAVHFNSGRAGSCTEADSIACGCNHASSRTCIRFDGCQRDRCDCYCSTDHAARRSGAADVTSICVPER
jgi:beta-lactamase regulating signal transducer with metallopeptidase domain